MDDAILEYLIGDGHDACRIGPGIFRLEDCLEVVGEEIARDLAEQRRAWQVLDPELAPLDDFPVSCEYRGVPDERAVVLTVCGPERAPSRPSPK